MAKNKTLQPWAHVELKRRKKMRQQDAVCKKAKIRPETFKRIEKEGWGSVEVIDRIEVALKDEMTPEQITAARIRQHVNAHRDAVIATIQGRKGKTGSDSVPRQLEAFLMKYEAHMPLEDIAGVLGYAGKRGVVKAADTIFNYMENNTDFRRVVNTIKREMGC